MLEAFQEMILLTICGGNLGLCERLFRAFVINASTRLALWNGGLNEIKTCTYFASIQLLKTQQYMLPIVFLSVTLVFAFILNFQPSNAKKPNQTINLHKHITRFEVLRLQVIVLPKLLHLEANTLRMSISAYANFKTKRTVRACELPISVNTFQSIMT